jgi:hypothetical protein
MPYVLLTLLIPTRKPRKCYLSRFFRGRTRDPLAPDAVFLSSSSPKDPSFQSLLICEVSASPLHDAPPVSPGDSCQPSNLTASPAVVKGRFICFSLPPPPPQLVHGPTVRHSLDVPGQTCFSTLSERRSQPPRPSITAFQCNPSSRSGQVPRRSQNQSVVVSLRTKEGRQS